ncbi:MAG TPA: type II toxin-antitoxin system Phd/YefM family antitoxin [Anaerolineae bacterium]|nr:type II toxin-antitoxin system Phd/YefM family antitoxin [Anaerolineae bacterium]
MSQEIGIRELKNQTSRIVRRVREEAAEYVITHHGQPVAVLRPFLDEDAEIRQRQKALDEWHEFLELGKELTESDPLAPLPRHILEEMREEESQWPS